MKAKSDITGIALIISSALILIFLCVPFIIGAPGYAVLNFFLGVFGYAVYPYAFMALAVGMMVFLNRKVTLKRAKIFSALGMYICGMLILHLITSSAFIHESASFGSYLSDCYNKAGTMGGSLFGLLTYPIASMTGKVFSYILFTFLFVVSALGWTNFSVLKLNERSEKRQAVIPSVVSQKPEPLTIFSKDYARSASQVRPINKTLFVSTITDNRAVSGSATAEPPKTIQEIKKHAKDTLLTGFSDEYKKPEPVLVSVANAHDLPRPLVHGDKTEQTGRNEYGFNPASAIEAHLGNYSAPKRQSESIRVMPSKVSVSPDIKTSVPNKIIYDSADASIKEKKAEEPVPVRRVRIIDGDTESKDILQEREQFQNAGLENRNMLFSAPEPTQKDIKNFEEKLVVGDVESERLKASKAMPPPLVQAALDAIPLKPKLTQEPKLRAKELLRPEPPKNSETDKNEPKQRFVLDTASVPIDFSKLKDKSKNIEIEEMISSKSVKPVIEPKISDNEPLDPNTESFFEDNLFDLNSGGFDIGQPMANMNNDKASDYLVSDETDNDFGMTEFEKKIEPLVKESGDYALQKTSVKNSGKDLLKNQINIEDYITMSEPEKEEDAIIRKPKKKVSKYFPPSIELLDSSSTFSGEIDEACNEKARLLEETLQHFGTSATVIGISKGPAVTRYELQMTKGNSVKRVHERADDIAYALAARSGIRIEAPIPGKQAVGVEVPNEKTEVVGLKDIIDSREFSRANEPLTFALGKDVAGKVMVCGLSSMPHLLIAGSTNSGKSSCLNSLITSLVYKYSPEELRFLLIDPKRVEFINYEGLPHLLLEKAITEPEAAISSLNWIYHESERRYKIFAQTRVKNIVDYKEKFVGSEDYESLPYIVIIIDEVSDLMLDNSNRKQIEDKVKYLSAKARAAGIHLVLATQRPSVDVLTGTIKANLPSRIAFSVTNFVDSKTILDSGGAEKLLGKGDMLFSCNNREPLRIQGAFIKTQEVEAVVNHIKMHNECDFDEGIKSSIYTVKETVSNKDAEDSEDSDKPDMFMLKVLKYFIESQRASISIVQRKFSVGFNKAANIVDNLELQGFIGPSDGVSKQRPIYITIDEFIERFGDVDLD